MHRKFHKYSLSTSGVRRADGPLSQVHSDLCGKITPKSALGAEYSLIMSRYCLSFETEK